MKVNRKTIGTLALVMGTFFNPLGYDIAFAMLMKLTGSYWNTTFFFYLLSACFFGLYFHAYKINPFNFVAKRIKAMFKVKSKK